MKEGGEGGNREKGVGRESEWMGEHTERHRRRERQKERQRQRERCEYRRFIHFQAMVEPYSCKMIPIAMNLMLHLLPRP